MKKLILSFLVLISLSVCVVQAQNEQGSYSPFAIFGNTIKPKASKSNLQIVDGTSILSDVAFPFAIKSLDDTAFTGINIPVSDISENTRNTPFGFNRMGITNGNALDYGSFKHLLTETVTLNPDGNPTHAQATTDMSTLNLPTNYYVQVTGTSNGKDGVYISPTMSGTLLTIVTLSGGNPGFINETAIIKILAQEVFLGSMNVIGLKDKLTLYTGQTETGHALKINNLGTGDDIRGTNGTWHFNKTGDGVMHSLTDNVASWSTITSPVAGSALQGFTVISGTYLASADFTTYLTNGAVVSPLGNFDYLQFDSLSSFSHSGDGYIYYNSGDDEFKFRENGSWNTLQWTRDSVDAEIIAKNSGDSIRLIKSGPAGGDIILEDDGWASEARLAKSVPGETRGLSLKNQVNLATGNSFQFNGSTKIDFGNHADYNLYDNSIGFWIKCTGNSMLVMGKKSAASNGWYFYVAADGKMNFYAQQGASVTNLTSTTVINDGNWHGIVMTKGVETNTTQLWIDGTSEASGANIGAVSNTQNFILGTWATDTLYFTGYLDEFVIVNQEKDEAWVDYYYSGSGHTGVAASEVLLGLHFENNYLDYSYTEHVGTLTGTALYAAGWVVDSAAVWVNIMESYDDTTLGVEGRINYGNLASNVHFRGKTITMDGDIASQNIEPKTDNTYYLGKNDDDTPFAYKGLILKDQAGTGKYYRVEVYNNAIRIVDLTD